MPVSAENIVRKLLAEAGIEINGSRPWDFRVHDARVFRRILTQGSLGAGEAYMDGWWGADSLDEFFCRFLRAKLQASFRHKNFFRDRILPRIANLQSRRRSLEVGERHYDLGNEFYEAMLDPHWMQYTCAYWKDADSLEKAQAAKLDLICRKLKLKPGEQVLELGGGWGGFARYAAEHFGVAVTVYNISREQVAWARNRIKGLPVTFHLKDYRDAEGLYDKIVSIGLCEHVGRKNYRNFFALKARCLKDDGLAFLHTIGSNFTKTWSDPWFTKYVFPGGFLPSLRQLTGASEAFFVQEDFHNLGSHYDKTLMAWHRNFEQNWSRFRDHYGDRFYRMWKYYLLSCAGAFRARNIQLWQIVYSKTGVKGGYKPVR